MTSDQKYEDMGNNALSDEQPVTADHCQTANQPIRQWQANYLRRLACDWQSADWLFELLETVRDICETTDPTEGMCLLLSEFLVTQPHRVANYGSELAAVTKHIARINDLNSFYRCLNNVSDYADEQIEATERQVAYAERKGVRGE